MAYCSPQQSDHYKEFKSCFDKQTLLRIALHVNRFYPNNTIKNIQKLSHRQLWNEINNRFKQTCGNNQEVCWVEQLNMVGDQTVKQSLRPETPNKWLKNPHTWLTNFNIEDVMEQYERANTDFKFLGVYPVDFRSRNYFNDNKCLYEETCNIDIESLLEKGIYYIGMIINLDKHDEPGSHWVALFTCIDPSQPCFGSYYYDSYAGQPPKDVQDFMNDLQQQANMYAKSKKYRRKFKVDYNKVRHQYGNSECGMFSMVFIIRWMRLLHIRRKVTLADIVNVKITDQDVFKMRKVLYRPYYQLKKNII